MLVKVSGQWRRVTQSKLKIGGGWRDISGLWHKVDGEWREVLLNIPLYSHLWMNYQIDEGLEAESGEVISWVDGKNKIVISSDSGLRPLHDSTVRLNGNNTVKFYKPSNYSYLKGESIDTPALSERRITVAMLVKFNTPSAMTLGHNRHMIWMEAAIACGYPFYDAREYFLIKYGSSGFHFFDVSSKSMQDDLWHVVIVSVDYSVDGNTRVRLRVNIDGEHVESTTYVTSTFNAPSRLYVGCPPAPLHREGMEGNVGAVMIWGNVLFETADCKMVNDYIRAKYNI